MLAPSTSDQILDEQAAQACASPSNFSTCQGVRRSPPPLAHPPDIISDRNVGVSHGESAYPFLQDRLTGSRAIADGKHFQPTLTTGRDARTPKAISGSQRSVFPQAADARTYVGLRVSPGKYRVSLRQIGPWRHVGYAAAAIVYRLCETILITVARADAAAAR
jgi:hypothetical protein